MFRRRPRPGAQEVAPKEPPGDGDFRRSHPRLPKLTPPPLRAAQGARGSGGSRIPRGGAAWWPEGDAEPGVGVGSPPPRLPALPTATRRAAGKRGLLQSLLLPPLLSDSASRTSAPRQPGPGERERPWRGVAREDPSFLGAFLGELLPSRFREFLHQLREKCTDEEPLSEAPQGPGAFPVGGGPCVPAPPTSTTQAQKDASVSRVSQSPRNLSLTASLPSPRGRPHSVAPAPRRPRKDVPQPMLTLFPPASGSSILSTATSKGCVRALPGGSAASQPLIPPRPVTPALGSLKADRPQFSTVRKASHRPSGKGSGPHRPRCPFRVRFADETLQDTLLRYWERQCSVTQSVTVNRKATRPVASEREFGNIGKWLQSLHKALYPEAKEETLASSSCWHCAGLPSQKTQGDLSEDTSMNSSLPFSSWKKDAAQRPRRGLQAFLDPHGLLEQESFLPSLVLQSVLKQGRPEEYSLLLPSPTLHRAQR
ncbi:uncharacterized protein C9orf50 homolog isoform X3 [Callithrix jacchus]|uniref:uncharacterized protein C9orf50 homolog isoform X3 n=1 Tax=Callithrix jacchus TaxID=9483 RepID=UPI00159E2894|nr:uncharacterized protein C9orf50 homolog isoform X3 [Callithrix jacchus]